MSSYKAIITGTGRSLPQQVVSNEDLAKVVETSDEWITTRTGIKERRKATADEDPPGNPFQKAHMVSSRVYTHDRGWPGIETFLAGSSSLCG